MSKWILTAFFGMLTVSVPRARAEQGSFCSGRTEVEYSCHEMAFGPGWTQGTDGCLYRDVGDCSAAQLLHPRSWMRPQFRPSANSSADSASAKSSWAD